MDEMKIGSKLLKGIISKLLAKTIREKTGIEPIISFASPITANVETKDDGTGFAHMHLDLNITVDTKDISSFVQNLL